MHHAWSITIKLANGRTETWISDRTGHKSSRQIHHYKRAARKVAELGLGDFAPLDEAIPELNGRGGRLLGGSDPMSAGPEAGSPSPSNGASFVRALHHRAPAAVDDHAGQPAAGAPVAAGGPLGPRWATPESEPAANQTEHIEIIDIYSASAASSQKSWRDS
ncbi:hypothetical protein WME97_16990 [Sorangium sp. So ce367]|uniref:hypothetical protein n=1 Tax=Sorangium sp. So ce367 TaxID=3133305 RepID=UPI003F5E145B